MQFITYFALSNFIGWTIAFAALGLWWRAPSDAPGRRLGAVFMLLAGIGVSGLANYRWARLTDAHILPDLFSLQMGLFLGACLALFAFGWIKVRSAAGSSKTEPTLCAWSVALALIVTLFELNFYQYHNGTTDQQTIDHFHKLLFAKTVADINSPRAGHWLGIECMQNPADIWVHQEIISEVKPDFIVETGTYKGGSATIWATFLQNANPQGRVITIDELDMVKEARELPLVKEKIDFLIGKSTSPAIVAEVAKRVRGKKVMVILDSDHQAKYVLEEIKAYAPLVSVGHYLIVQDTNQHGHPVDPGAPPGPMEAVEEFLAGDDRFVSDRTREKFLFSMHPKGYLKRVK